MEQLQRYLRQALQMSQVSRISFRGWDVMPHGPSAVSFSFSSSLSSSFHQDDEREPEAQDVPASIHPLLSVRQSTSNFPLQHSSGHTAVHFFLSYWEWGKGEWELVILTPFSLFHLSLFARAWKEDEQNCAATATTQLSPHRTVRTLRCLVNS